MFFAVHYILHVLWVCVLSEVYSTVIQYKRALTVCSRRAVFIVSRRVYVLYSTFVGESVTGWCWCNTD